jgi:hypothetical protein
MDRGMTSAETVTWLQGTGRRYLIGASKSDLKKLAPHVVDARDWCQVRDGIEAKLCAGPDGNETFVLVRSAERREKEQAMHARFAERIETALARLAGRLDRARNPVDRGVTERQIGRLLGRNSRAAGRYAIRLIEDKAVAAGLRLEWSARVEWDEWSRHSEGCYVLRTNVRDWTPEALWRTYIQLTEAEVAFRIHKSDLSIRPIGISTKAACRLTSWSASSLTSCGRRSSSGRAAQVSAIAHAPSFRSSAPSAAPTSSCRPQPRRNAICACAASSALIAPRPLSSIASAYDCPRGSACTAPDAKCSANFGTQVLENTHSTISNCGSWARLFLSKILQH